jgi:hypothetical protein
MANDRNYMHKHYRKFDEMLKSITSDEAFSIGTKFMSSRPSIDLLRAGVEDDFDPFDVVYFVKYKGKVEYIDDDYSIEDMEYLIDEMLGKGSNPLT